MACSNCFNGCTEIVSDQCVKYTGIDVPVLGIKKGDSLSYVEQALITFLTSTLDGTGIKITIPETTVICNLVQKYLPTCEDLTAVNLFNALIQAACELQTELDATNDRIDVIESPYLPGCFTTFTESSNTHTVVQEIITKVCGIESDLSALAIDLSTNYVKLSDLCTLIIECINQNTPADSGKYYTKMVPYTAVEYYGDINVFDSSGKGFEGTPWEKIYLCNGQNPGVPDKRGRVGVGVTFGTGMDAAVAPGGLNPTYNLFTKAGTNSVTLSRPQIPSHTHTATVTINDPGHQHNYETRITNNRAQFSSDEREVTTYAMSTLQTQSSVTGLKGTGVGQNVFVTNAEEGGGFPHANNQPAIACYYIMYIP
jgi:microcystin-dependent protein